MTGSEETLNITVTFRGESHSLSAFPDSTIAALQLQLEELTTVPPSLQKLLYKGKKSNVPPESTIEHAGLKDGVKMQLVGSRTAELGGMHTAESEKRKKEEILRQRKTMNLPKPRSTGGSSSASTLNYRFHNLVPLPHLPAPDTALALLSKLSSDPATQHIMQTHQFSVGTLTELAPHEQPHLLGLNVNRGEAIKLRLRTDAYDGFRLYADVRRVLCHELAHNVWGDHDDNFKKLNSQLNKDVADFERAQRTGAHTLRDSGPAYTPSLSSSPSLFSPELESEAQAYILGGSSSSGPVNDSREERRRRVLDAAVSRLQKEEEELEQSCGTARSAHDRDADAPTSSMT